MKASETAHAGQIIPVRIDRCLSLEQQRVQRDVWKAEDDEEKGGRTKHMEGMAGRMEGARKPALSTWTPAAPWAPEPVAT